MIESRTKRGTVNQPTTCFNAGEYARRFGGLWSDSTVSYVVDDFYRRFINDEEESKHYVTVGRLTTVGLIVMV